jgi:hypothetical protein
MTAPICGESIAVAMELESGRGWSALAAACPLGGLRMRWLCPAPSPPPPLVRLLAASCASMQ